MSTKMIGDVEVLEYKCDKCDKENVLPLQLRTCAYCGRTFCLSCFGTLGKIICNECIHEARVERESDQK